MNFTSGGTRGFRCTYASFLLFRSICMIRNSSQLSPLFLDFVLVWICYLDKDLLILSMQMILYFFAMTLKLCKSNHHLARIIPRYGMYLTPSNVGIYVKGRVRAVYLFRGVTWTLWVEDVRRLFVQRSLPSKDYLHPVAVLY